jgi:hypothetical protein
VHENKGKCVVTKVLIPECATKQATFDFLCRYVYEKQRQLRLTVIHYLQGSNVESEPINALDPRYSPQQRDEVLKKGISSYTS